MDLWKCVLAGIAPGNHSVSVKTTFQTLIPFIGGRAGKGLVVVAMILMAGIAHLPAQDAAQTDYRLAANDLLDFRVFQEPEMDAVIRISGDGSAVFPLVGSVNIGGKTIGEAINLLKSHYQDGYLVSPQLSVTVRAYSKKRFTVLGQVQRPGSYEIQGTEEVSLLQAIGMAGGYTRISDPSQITVKRKEGGREQVLKFNAKKMAKTDTDSTFQIKAGDVITVAESMF